MSGKKRYGDPRKNQAAQESSEHKRARSKRELSIGFILFAWIVFFVLWLTAGFFVAAIVFGVLLLGGITLLKAR
jgi:Flp pilus assembly protein TadB